MFMTRCFIVGVCFMLCGCGSVTDLRRTSPFDSWIDQSYPAAFDLKLYKHSRGLAKGEASYRLSEQEVSSSTPLANFQASTRFRVTEVELRSRLIGLPRIYVRVEVPLDGGTVDADIELFCEPYPIIVEWPNQSLPATGDARE